MSHPEPAVMTSVTVPSRVRLYFVDYLRGTLVSLVILHHTAITYGGTGSFYYTGPATGSAASMAVMRAIRRYRFVSS